MNELIVIGFDRLEDAREAMKRLRRLEDEDQIHFEDTAIVERDPDGKAHVKNEISGTTETATAIGTLLGSIMSFVFPIAGIVVGAALGAALGTALQTGVPDDFVHQVKGTLRPGRSALFLVVKDANADATVALLRPFTGEVIQTTLPAETEDALRAAVR